MDVLDPRVVQQGLPAEQNPPAHRHDFRREVLAHRPVAEPMERPLHRRGRQHDPAAERVVGPELRIRPFDGEDGRFGGAVSHEPIELDPVLGTKARFVAGCDQKWRSVEVV